MIEYTAWQLIKAFIFYSLVAVVIPAIVLGDKLKGKSFAMRFFIYFTTGNFYIINLVYLLELFHLSYKVTLILFTVVPAFLAYMFVHRKSTAKLAEDTYVATERLARGTYGFKTWVLRTVTGLGKGIAAGVKRLWEHIYKNIPDIILTVGILVACWIFFGRFVLEQYGYGASDMIVHHYWINGLDENRLFIDGVYPFGFHNVIYYLHQVFGLEILDLLRVFWVVTLMYTAFIMVVFLRAITKSKYVVYLGVLCYLGMDICVERATSRFYSALPQEFGMIFVPVGIYFALEFFKARKIEVDEIKRSKAEKKEEEKRIAEETTVEPEPKKKFKLHVLELKPSTYMLAGIAACISISFTIHSYVTIIMALAFFGIAIGYCVRFFNYRYFFRVVASCIVGMIVAVVPMGLALLFGNHLQGSFGWGYSIISGDLDKKQDTLYGGALLNGREIDDELIFEIWKYKEATPVEVDGEIVYIKDAINLDNIDEEYAMAMENKANELGISLEELMVIENRNNQSDDKVEQELEEEDGSFIQKVAAKLAGAYQSFTQAYDEELEYMFKEEHYNLIDWFLAAIILVGLLGISFIIAGKYERGFTYISLFVASLLMAIGFRGEFFGLPSLFDNVRACALNYYFLWIYPVMAVDGIIYLLIGFWDKKSLDVTMNVVSAVVMAIGVFSFLTSDLVRSPEHDIIYECNGNILTVTNIINNNENGNWTIVSANDENQTISGHGYHYEMTKFLRNMEYYYTSYIDEEKESKEVGMDPVTIPSEKVYFFIEKMPLDYTDEGYALSGSSIGEEAASHSLDYHKGLMPYKNYNRNIYMSRMMAWAKRFDEIYPNEFSVYYEDDEFVCYAIDQNAYSLYNFAIDYGYNMTDFPEYHEQVDIEENR